MQKDDLVYAGHMLDLARSALGKLKGKTRQEYDEDENLRLALVHLLQNIGEAARRVSSVLRSEHPEIPWTSIVGLRHRVVHDYLQVNFGIVWDVVLNDLAPLIAQLEVFVPEADTQTE